MNRVVTTYSKTFFSQLTHLEVWTWTIDDDFVAGVGAMPALTHLALLCCPLFEPCVRILAECRRLKVLVLPDELPAKYGLPTPLTEDMRFVMCGLCCNRLDWEGRIVWQPRCTSFWIDAEEHVKRRLSGETEGRKETIYSRQLKFFSF